MKKKRVMIIAHFCDAGSENSNNRFNYIANMMANEGYEVELVTSSFSHRDKKQRDRVPDGMFSYITTLIHEPSYKKNVSLKRLFISHHVMAENLKKYLEVCNKPDLIYCAIPSINVAEVAAQYAEKNTLPFLIDVQDLWPEAYRLIIKNEKIYKFATFLMKKRVDRIYASADEIVAVSDTYAKRAGGVNTKCKKTTAVYLGTDLQAFDQNITLYKPQYIKDTNEIWLGYCGTLGSSYDLSLFINAIHGVLNRGCTNIRLVIMGSGPLEEEFKTKAKELKVPCIFTGKLPYEEMCAQLSVCDIAVNPIAKGAAQSIINKHADYAMAGLPVISTQDQGEYSQLLSLYHCGFSCWTVEEIQNCIVDLVSNTELRLEMGNNSRKMAEEKFNRDFCYASIKELIQSAINRE